jgi:hypothetical protein
MELVGYKLIETATDNVVQSWGGTWGECPGVPNPLDLPNGDQVCGAQVGVNYNGFRLDPWEIDQPPAPVPQSVPMWAVRTVLQNDGLFDQAQTLIAASTDNALKNVWEYGNFADRNSNAIKSLATALNLTDAQVDQMFIDANNIEV